MGSMVEVKCKTEDFLLLDRMEPFQGKLKHRSEEDIERLASSIREEGLLMPFAVWKGKILDGHGRRLALLYLAKSDITIMEQEFPVVYIDAETEEEARKALLQITSSYGKVTGKGVREFTKAIPEYKAPVLDKFTKRVQHRRPKGSVNANVSNEEVDIRILVRPDKAKAVLELFRQTEYIKVVSHGEL